MEFMLDTTFCLCNNNENYNRWYFTLLLGMFTTLTTLGIVFCIIMVPSNVTRGEVIASVLLL